MDRTTETTTISRRLSEAEAWAWQADAGWQRDFRARLSVLAHRAVWDACSDDEWASVEVLSPEGETWARWDVPIEPGLFGVFAARDWKYPTPRDERRSA